MKTTGTKKKKITLLRPNMGDYRTLDAFPPLAMGILAARTPSKFEVKFYDDRVEATPLDESTDLVALSVETFTARRAYHIADAYRSRGIPVVMGGHHPTLMPDEVAGHADVVFTGDAEGVWEELLDDFLHGTLKDRYHGNPENFGREHKMDRSIFEGKKYGPALLVQCGRGCRHSCDFCSVHAFYGTRLCRYPTDTIVGEIAALVKRHPRRLLMFVDDNLYSSSSDLRELLEGIKPLGVRWACQISADVAKDADMLDRMAGSGCRVALIGFESLDAGNLALMGKSWNRTSGDYLEIVRKFHDRGIAVCGTFVFGYDRDTEKTIEDAINFVEEARLEMAQLNPLTPLPGTPFYERLQREGRLLRPGWWIDPEYRYGDPILSPPSLAPEKFAELCFDAKKRFYTWRSIAKRVFLPATGFDLWNMGLVGLSNLISRREVYRKQNRIVGK